MAKLISADLTNNKLCVLEYTTTDGQMLPIDIDYELFDGKIVLHTYTDMGRIIFETPITTVRVRAFYDCRNLTSITIPDSVIDIGTFAFSGCRNLTSITIGNSVTKIGEYAFYNSNSLASVYISDIAAWCNISFGSADSNPLCYEGNLYLNNKLVTDLTIPDSVTAIGNYAFYMCNNLTSITIGNSVTRIGEDAFYMYNNLTSVYISDIAAWCNISFDSAFSNPLYYEGNLYLNNKLVTDLTIPDSVTAIGNYAFYMCNTLTSITIGNSVTRIGKYAFYKCNNLTSVTIGNGVTRIGKSAFKECNIDTIVCCSEIPPKIDNSFDKLENLIVPTSCEEAYAHTDISSAKLISADLTNNKLCILEYTTNNRKMLSFKEGMFDAKIVLHTYFDKGKIIFDRPITKIGEKAFYWRFSLTSVTIPDSVTMIGGGAFSNCINLKEFKGKFAVDGGRCLIIYGVLNAFAIGCGVTQYTIPNRVTMIDECAFLGCSSLTSVTIPDSVKTIGDNAFSDCHNITSLTIGKGVSYIGTSAFKECNIDIIVCCSEIPPKIDNSFDKFENLIVPTYCEEAYANSDWGKYLK